MSERALFILGTASQVPTRERNHNGYFLRWDKEGLLFDPGEGTQRQMTIFGVAAPQITRIFISHFHGDHCLGLPGVLQRINLDRPQIDRSQPDRVRPPVEVYFPASGKGYYKRLKEASSYLHTTEIADRPIAGAGVVLRADGFEIEAERLDHSGEVYGFRLKEPDRRTMLPARLEEAGIRGPEIGRLQREGVLVREGREYRLEDLSVLKSGQAFAYVMDTRLTEACERLAFGADLALMESTYLESERDLAESYRHMTAAQAAQAAVRAGVKRLVLSHFSQRYLDLSLFAREAGQFHPDVVVAKDGMVVEVPRRERVLVQP